MCLLVFFFFFFYEKSCRYAAVIHFVLPTQGGLSLEPWVWKEAEQCSSSRKWRVKKSKRLKPKGRSCVCKVSWAQITERLSRQMWAERTAERRWNWSSRFAPDALHLGPSLLATWQCGVKCVLYGWEPRLAGANVACLRVKHFPQRQPVLCQEGSMEGLPGKEAVAVFPSPLRLHKT